MKYREFGNTGITVSEVGFGANSIAGMGTYGYVDESAGMAAVRRAYELGVTFFDTAEGYADGESETALGKALEGKQDVVICSKVGGRGTRGIVRESIREAAEASLKRLRREVIDVYLLHNPSDEQVADLSLLEELNALKRDGLVRAIGISLVTARQMEHGKIALDQGIAEGLEANINMVQQEAVDLLLPQASKQGVGIIARVPLGSGLLTGKYSPDTHFDEEDRRSSNSTWPPDRRAKAFELVRALGPVVAEEKLSMPQAAIAWILSNPAVSTVIAGCKTPAQAEENASASDITLSPRLLELIASYR